MFSELRLLRVFRQDSLPVLLVATLFLVVATVNYAAADEVVFIDPTRPPAKKVVELPVVDAAPEVEVIVETKRPGRAVRPRPKPLTLTSVLVSDQRRRAVINGQVVQEGQTVAGARVIGIELNGVTVQRAGRRQTLTLVNTNVKRRVINTP